MEYANRARKTVISVLLLMPAINAQVTTLWFWIQMGSRVASALLVQVTASPVNNPKTSANPVLKDIIYKDRAVQLICKSISHSH